MVKTLQDILSQSSIILKVKPNAAKTEILSVEEGFLRVSVKAPAEDNRANIALIKFFSRLTKKQVKIIRGLTSKTKVLKFF